MGYLIEKNLRDERSRELVWLHQNESLHNHITNFDNHNYKVIIIKKLAIKHQLVGVFFVYYYAAK